MASWLSFILQIMEVEFYFKFGAKMVSTSQTLSFLSNILQRHIRNDFAG